MHVGLTLPHYDFSIPGESPLRFETIVEHARAAEALGFDALYVSDHVSLAIEKYGGPPGEYFAYEPLTTLAAVALLTDAPAPSTNCRTPASLGWAYEAINYDITSDAELAAEPDPMACARAEELPRCQAIASRWLGDSVAEPTAAAAARVHSASVGRR